MFVCLIIRSFCKNCEPICEPETPEHLRYWEAEKEVLVPNTQLWERRHSHNTFVSLRWITWLNNQKKPVKGHVEDPRCSTCPLVCGSWELSHVIFLKLREKELLTKLSKFTKGCRSLLFNLLTFQYWKRVPAAWLLTDCKPRSRNGNGCKLPPD